MARGIVPLTGEEVEVPGDMFRVVEEITSRWPRLRVQFVDPDRSELNDPPYRVVELTPEGPVQVCAVWELNQTLIEKLHLMNAAGIDVEAAITAHNAKKREAEKKAEAEKNAEAADKTASVLKHFGKGKLEFHYTTDDGQKRVVSEAGSRDKETKVL